MWGYLQAPPPERSSSLPLKAPGPKRLYPRVLLPRHEASDHEDFAPEVIGIIPGREKADAPEFSQKPLV